VSAVQIDTARVDAVVGMLERQRARIIEIGHFLAELGRQFHLTEEVSQAVGLCEETNDEMTATRSILRQRAAMAMAADETTAAGASSGAQFAWAVRRLLQSLGDGVGATGGRDDRRRLLAQAVLGTHLDDDLAADLDDGLDRAVLGAAPPGLLADYWATLGVDARDRAIEHSTIPVSDAYLRGDIPLDDGQLVALQGRPVPLDGRHPSTGEGTDWAGFAIPEPPAEWAYDEPPRALLGGSFVCAGIQGFSPIPSPAPTTAVDATATAPGVARQIRNQLIDPAEAMYVGARGVPVANVIAGALDVVLCRLGVGSGAPISTERTINDDGVPVYEGSRTAQKYLIDGVPLHPDPRARDVQMWNHEHSNEHGYVMEPYPGFPAYETNAPGYPGTED
jgi:hypothetical protein